MSWYANRNQPQFLQNSSHRIWKRLSPKKLHHITLTSPRKQACNHVSFLICLILYTPIFFVQKLIKTGGIMYKPILFVWFNIKSNNVHTNFNHLNQGYTLSSFVHVLHFLEHKILRYVLRCSWLASK